jgi:hypothetical protein
MKYTFLLFDVVCSPVQRDKVRRDHGVLKIDRIYRHGASPRPPTGTSVAGVNKGMRQGPTDILTSDWITALYLTPRKQIICILIPILKSNNHLVL